MSRLRILFITAAYPTAEEPVQSIFVREHARAVALHHDVVVMHGPRLLPSVTWRLEEQRDPAICAGLRTFDLFYGASPIPMTHWLMYLHAAARAHEGLLRRGFVPQLVHANIYKAAVPGAVIAKLAGVPMVLTEHASDFPRRLLTPRQQLEAKTGYGGASVVMPVSAALLDGINRYDLFPRYQIVPNAVDTELFRPPTTAPRGRKARILFVGGMVPVKGVEGLLRAAARLQKQRRDWELELVGDGPQRQIYTELAQELGLAGRVRFVGALSKPEVAQRMQGADFLVLPSLWENLPCVALEAGCCGLPVVGTRVGGIPEVIGPDNGILCTPSDPGALAAALSDMLDRRGSFDRDRLSTRARGLYSRETVGEQIDRVYQEALRRAEQEE